jgi:hypothetical protein
MLKRNTETGEQYEDGKEPINEGVTITLDELVRRMQDASNKMGNKNPNRMLLFNSAAALVALGMRVEEADAKIAELTNRPRIVGHGGQHVN